MHFTGSILKDPLPRRALRGSLFALAVTLAPAAVAALAIAAPAQAAESGDWVGTWAASAQPVWEADFFLPSNAPRTLRDQTVRQVARVSVGGNKVRIVVSNEYGGAPMLLGAAGVGLSAGGSALKAGSAKPVTFGGQPSITVPAGARVVSDPVDVAVPPLGSLAVSLYFPEVTPTTTWHWDGAQTGYISAAGNAVAEADFKPGATTLARLFLTEILVDATPDTRAVVFYGDSITDGAASTADANHRWPDILAERLNKAGAKVAVINEGISGARILRDRMGVNALARFDRDVLSQPHADTVVLMMGINDIGWPDTILVPKGEVAPSAEDVIAGYKQLIAQAHMKKMRIVAATLTPFEDTFHGGPLFGYYSEAKEAKRQSINQWIRSGGAFDGVIDFEAATKDAANPKHMKAEFDSGDHLHPNDAGYKAMAESVDLTLLGVK